MTTETPSAALLAFASMPREQATAWLEQRQEENRQRRLAECAANGAHTYEMDARVCPNCDTPYDELTLKG